MPIYEDKVFLWSVHLGYLGRDDLPGSDAADARSRSAGDDGA
jgi:hypothetical protein